MRILLSLAFSVSSFTFLFGQEWFPTSSGIPEPSMAYEDYFGKSSSMEGDVAVVGAPENDELNLNSGKVFIYEKVAGNWQLVEELFSESAGENEYFGSQVLLKNGYLFVCAYGRDLNGIKDLGGVSVYKKVSGTWTYLNTLSPSDNIANTQFGISIAFNGSVLAIGAGYPNGGAVYIFNDPTSQAGFVTKIALEAAEAPTRFGVSVAMNSTTLFIGDSFCGQGSNRGAVFVYDLSNFNRIAKLVSSPIDNFYFATCLSATETELAVGSPYVTNPDVSYGSVFLYKKPAGGWVNAVEDVRFSSILSDDYGLYGSSVLLTNGSLIVGSDGGTALDFFDKPAGGWSASATKFTLRETGLTYVERYGSSFATNGTDVFVGAYNLNVPNESSGAVYQYKKNNSEWSSIEETGILREYSISASASSFGHNVDIDGKYAIVGSPFDDEVGKDAGAAYVLKFVENKWERIAKLTASDGETEDYFGYSAAISGDMIIISAKQANTTHNNGVYSTGAVYVFRKPSGSEWNDSHESEVIPRVDNLKEGSFGFHVDVKNNVVAISHFREGSSDEIGKVYLMEKVGSTWEVKANLSPSENTVRLFGFGLTLDNSLLAVGSTFQTGFNGAVLIFEKPASGWADATQNAILHPSDPTFTDGFGHAVSVEDNTIIIGGTQPYPAGLTGAAYVYEKTGAHWVDATETVKLLPEGEAAGSKFGFSVALSGNFAAVASATANSGNGKVLLYKRSDNQWETTPYAFLEIPSSGGTNNFGYSMDMKGDYLAVGATGTSTSAGKGSGSVEFYTKQPTVTHVTSSTADGEYQVDDIVNVKVSFSHAVSVSGNPAIQMALDNDIVQIARFKNITNENEVNFEYTVHENDFSDDLDYTAANALDVPAGSSIKSKIINQDGNFVLPAPGSANSLGGSKSIVINGEVVVATEEDSDSDVQVYPNPFTGFVRVVGNNIQSIELFNMEGKLVLASSQNFSEVITVDLAQSIYLLKITSGKRTIYRKVVKY